MSRKSELNSLIRKHGFYFLDFEASSLSQNSWPIEIGVARIVNGVAKSESLLISPHESWSPQEWHAASEKIHGISRKKLVEKGTSAVEAVEWFAKRAGGIAVSDAPEFDTRWLDKLFRAANRSVPVQFLDLDSFIAVTVNGDDEVDQIYASLDKEPVPHRAGQDAERLARIIGRYISQT